MYQITGVFTGNDVLNRRLRLLAESKGFRLDDTRLFLAIIEVMDRGWMHEKRTTIEYLEGLEGFLKFVEENKSKTGEEFISCPCRDSRNLRKFYSSEKVRSHLIRCGFEEGYSRCVWHGESLIPSMNAGDNRVVLMSHIFKCLVVL